MTRYRLWCGDCNADGEECNRYLVDELLNGHENQNPGHTADCMEVAK